MKRLPPEPSNIPYRTASPSVPGSLHEIIGEEEFLGQLGKAMAGMVRLHNAFLRTPRGEWGKRHFDRMFQEADELETFLDDHGARNNRSFFPLREVVAGVRGFAAATHVLKHLEMRLPQYPLLPIADEIQEFREALVGAYRFSCDALTRLLDAVAQEARRLGVSLPTEVVADGQITEAVVTRKLPHTLQQARANSRGDHAIEFCQSYLEVCRKLDAIPQGPFPAGAPVRRFLEAHCHEEDARTFEAMVHNLQSSYDTYLRHTAEEVRQSDLPLLRGHASVSLHLFEFTVLLVHFYERHEKHASAADLHAPVALALDSDRVLDHAVNFSLHWARRFLLMAVPIAESLLKAAAGSGSVELELPGDAILHARPAALIVNIVNRYGQPVEIEIDGERANAASIMQVMILAGTKAGCRTIVFRGASDALRDLRVLFASGLGEDGLDKLPAELAYLREGSSA